MERKEYLFISNGSIKGDDTWAWEDLNKKDEEESEKLRKEGKMVDLDKILDGE